MQTDSSSFVFPDHVPQELRWDHSLREYAHEMDDPFLAVSRLHDGPDIFYARDATQERPAWVITRHELLKEAFLDYEHFSSRGGSGLDELMGNDFRLVPIDYDPPEQTAFRKIINPFFTASEVRALEGPVQETCDRLIAEFEDKGECEFINDFAAPFPSYIFLSLVGLPVEEVSKFLDWEIKMLRGENPEERAEAAYGVFHYLLNFMQEQRKKPTNDMVKAIIEAEVDGRPIKDEEILGILFTFYTGGLDTVYSTLGWTMRHLALDQELQQNLRENLDLIPKAVEEFLRAYSVVSTGRKIAEDVNFHGVEMRKGDLVLMPLFLAGRDPKTWANPHEIKFDRKAGALPFGNGPHVCVGRELARRELRIALESWLTRFKDIRIKEGDHYDYHTSPVYGVDRLPLTFTRIE